MSEAVVRAERLPLARIDAGQRQAMLALLQAHFDGVDAEAFHEDLQAKQGAILIRDAQGALLGFSTWLFYDDVSEGERVRVAYFGDTIVDRRAWNSPALPAAVIRLLMDEAARAAPQRLFSLLLCAGFRTYRFMRFFCRDYVPRPGGDPALLRRRDGMAQRRFGAQYDAAMGIVRLQRGAYRLKPGLAEPDGHLLSDPAAAYFVQADPGWRQGDELVCLAEMREDNLSAVSRRLLRAGA